MRGHAYYHISRLHTELNYDTVQYRIQWPMRDITELFSSPSLHKERLTYSTQVARPDPVADLERGTNRVHPLSPLPLGRRTDAVTVLLISDSCKTCTSEYSQ